MKRQAAGLTYRNSIFSSVGRQIRVCPAPSGIVGGARIWRGIVLQVTLNSILLITWDRKVVGESSPRIEESRRDELFTRALRLIHGGIYVNWMISQNMIVLTEDNLFTLSGPDRCNIWTRAWKRRAEKPTLRRLRAVRIQAYITKACNSIITAGE
jgi:hypothetical protein